MLNTCKLCGRQFEAKVYNNFICDNPHYIKCRICDTEIYMNGEENKKKRKMYFDKGYVYCSHLCSCKGVGIDKYNKANTGIDLEKLKYLKTQTDMFDKDIAEELGVSVEFVIDRCKRNNWIRPQELQESLQENKNIKISNALTEKYKDDSIKAEVLKKASETYKARTGYEHNFKNPEAIKKYKAIKLERYGSEKYTNPQKMKQTRKFKNGGLFWTKKQLEQVKQTKIKKYGQLQPEQLYKNMSEESKEILLNRPIFITYILEIPYDDRTFTNISKKLGVSYATVNRYYHLYGCDKLIPINLSVSNEEKEIVRFLKTLYSGTIIENSRSIISPYELDIYIPDKHLAIEYNGSYYHTASQIPKDYHYNKSKMCEEKGIRLIHIFEYEWENERQRPILENIIKNALGINQQKIYARKCKIKIMPSKNMRKFFDDNNIQGFRGGKFAICLEYNGEIVMSYMMGNAYFGKGKYEWEVIRGATKLGYTIVGGASKIWKYFIETYNPKNCVYYIDYNYFNGNSLKNLSNMEFIKTQFSFKNFWVKEKKVKNREPLRHKEIKELEKQGLVIPIYNAGTKIYVYNREN